MERVRRKIGYREAIDFVLPRHYSGRKPCVSIAYGEYENGVLKSVITFGSPASPFLCRGIAGEKYTRNVIELNRMCCEEDYAGILSSFVSWCLHDLKKQDLIVVSFSDTAMFHHGYVYQACNFIYTGLTKTRTDKFTEQGKHARHYDNDKQGSKRKIRSAKHRYVYLCASSKKVRKEMLLSLKYKSVPYPKGDNVRYTLGEYLKDEYVETNRRKS